MTIGTFCLIKDEARFIGPHLASWLPRVDQMTLYDGNSTDGTLDIVKQFQKHHPSGYKILLHEDKDPKDLQGDYQRMFTECLWSLTTDLAIFAHADMILADPGNISGLDCIAASMQMETFAGDPGGQLYKINGRAKSWKNVFRLRKPDLGAHYFGAYGAWNEDVYFSEITGDSHDHYGEIFSAYPYEVVDSRALVYHFSDVRPHSRRLERMKKCLINQGHPPENVDNIAENHPRVTLKSSNGLEFAPAVYPDIFNTWKETLLCQK